MNPSSSPVCYSGRERVMFLRSCLEKEGPKDTSPCGLAMVPALAAATVPDGDGKGSAVRTLEGMPVVSFSSSWPSEDSVIKNFDESPCQAPRPRKLQLLPNDDDDDGHCSTKCVAESVSSLEECVEISAPVETRRDPSLLELSAVPYLSRSLPSSCSNTSIFGGFPEENAFFEEPRTPPDASSVCGSYAAPLAPKKSCKVRPTPLRKKQPRKLFFGTEGPASTPDFLESPETLPSMNNRFQTGSSHGNVSVVPTANVDFEPLDNVEGKSRQGMVQTPVVEHPRVEDTSTEEPQTPPDKLFCSFSRHQTPKAPKKGQRVVRPVPDDR